MIKYSVIRSKRKTLSLQVNDKCEVIVRAPLRYPESKINEFVKEHTAWIEKAVLRQKQNSFKFDSLTESDIEILKNRLREYLPGKLDYYSELMGVRHNGYKVTSARKRFGSCSGRNTLCFSYILMLYPEEAIDYVIVHELSHLIYADHSKRFWDLVEENYPEYKKIRKLLKEY